MIRKLIDVRVDDVPDNSNPASIVSITIGDKLINDVLSGGYNVQPVPLPNSLFIDIRITVYDNGIRMTDMLLTLGYATSDAPKYIGTNIFPKAPNTPGITKKNIISNPCKVILRLYMFWFSVVIILFPEVPNSNLINTDNIVPDIPNKNVASK